MRIEFQVDGHPVVFRRDQMTGRAKLQKVSKRKPWAELA